MESTHLPSCPVSLLLEGAPRKWHHSAGSRLSSQMLSLVHSQKSEVQRGEGMIITQLPQGRNRKKKKSWSLMPVPVSSKRGTGSTGMVAGWVREGSRMLPHPRKCTCCHTRVTQQRDQPLSPLQLLPHSTSSLRSEQSFLLWIRPWLRQTRLLHPGKDQAVLRL